MVVEVSNDLSAKRENGFPVGLFIFMEMKRRNFQGIIQVCGDLVVIDLLVIILNLDHQRMEIYERLLVHRIIFRKYQPAQMAT